MGAESAIESFKDYSRRLTAAMDLTDWTTLQRLAESLQECHAHGRQVFLCGNGGSAGNALHIVNDLFYGIRKGKGPGLKVQALPANVSLLTCLANDEGYDQIYSFQLRTLASPGDIVVVLSGSGNSANILAALEEARRIGMTSFAILGYGGGRAKQMADHALHFAVDDMQISEDLQLIVGHMLMQWLCRQ